MVRRCSVKGCKSQNRELMMAPSDNLKEWIRNLNLHVKRKCVYACRKHFRDEDVYTWAQRIRLKKGALPVLKLGIQNIHQENKDTNKLEVEDSSYPYSEHNYFSRTMMCHKEFDNLSSLKQHKIIRTDVESYSCKDCNKSFSSKDNFRHHSENCNSKDKNKVTKELHTDIYIKEESIDENDFMQNFDEITQNEMFSEDPLMLVTEESYQFIDCGDSVKQEIKEEIDTDMISCDPLFIPD
eukprot:TRINITY_DN24042_c0_g1_i11.p1 TRINITY_DN24042_c0_g1~~TRINITY_DN24042_c0_g1_i11.p1  ORF type:complete len:239 (+),score=24.09 TRINITY_DN24042_c0_g1_i11:25-741(+)